MNISTITTRASSSRFLFLSSCVLAGLLFLTLSHPAHAATITVNTMVDATDNTPTCPLRAAIAAANSNQPVAGCPAGDSGPDTLHFTAPGTITLTAGQLSISESLTIDAATTPITLDGNANQRLFRIEPSATVLLTGLTLSNGLAPAGEDGGAIYNQGHLTLDGCLLNDNQAGTGSATQANGSGGGIYNSGWLTLTHSLLQGNRTGTSATQQPSQAIEQLGMAELLDLEAVETASLSLADGEGGGLYNVGQVWVRHSQFLANVATNSGGALFVQRGSGDLYDVLLAGNQAANEDEAIAIAAGATVTLAPALTLSVTADSETDITQPLLPLLSEAVTTTLHDPAATVILLNTGVPSATPEEANTIKPRFWLPLVAR